jgi:riboflavin kinase / FMN adenylyltransferase
VRATVDGITHSAAANVGPNPTFGDDARKIEVHLLDFAGDLYGRELRVTFVKRLRDTRPFAGVQELTEQLRRDVADARTALG